MCYRNLSANYEANELNDIKETKSYYFDLDDTFYSYKEAHAIALKKVQLKLNNEFGVNEKIFTKYYDLENKNLKKILKNTASSHNKFLYFKNFGTIKIYPLYKDCN